MRKLKYIFLSVAALALASCQVWSSMIGLEVSQEGDDIVFSDPNSTWFQTYCITSIDVTRYEKTSETSWQQVEQMWEASSIRGECLTDLPFRYGQEFANLDPSRSTVAKPLERGFRYDIFLEQGGGAGQGSFTIDKDGKLIDLEL